MPQAEKMCDNCRSAAVKAMRKYGKKRETNVYGKIRIVPQMSIEFYRR